MTLKTRDKPHRERKQRERMGSCSIPVKSLSSGREMPVIGMGTADSNLAGSDASRLALVKAIEVGYRHFDTASIYQSEQNLGDAIAQALELGLIKSRDELFITSKLWSSDSHPDRVVPALQESLRKLKLEYLDLYLIHWPASSTPGIYEFPIPKDEIFPLEYETIWAAMEECQRLGLTKSIGVSNFSSKKLQTILNTATIPPAANQVEMNPVWQQKKLKEFCDANNILLTAYSPLGAKGTSWGSNKVMESEVLKQIAMANGKSVAQVSLRWLYQIGATMVVKSYNAERMKENLKIFDWELSDEDMKAISEIPQRRNFAGDILISSNGPFKSEDELWDGEV